MFLALVDRTTPSRFGGSQRVIRGIFRQEGGLTAFYRGLAPNILGNSTSWAFYFLFYSGFKDVMSESRLREGKILSSADFFLASGAAGLCPHSQI